MSPAAREHELDRSDKTTFHDRNLTEGRCRMCLAIPGKIVQVFAEDQDTALVEVVGVRRRVDLGLLQDEKLGVGDWVLIHVGFAMCKISEQDAWEQMQTLTMLGEAEAAIDEVRGLEEEPKVGTDS